MLCCGISLISVPPSCGHLIQTHRGLGSRHCRWQSWVSNLRLCALPQVVPSAHSPSHVTGYSVLRGEVCSVHTCCPTSTEHIQLLSRPIVETLLPSPLAHTFGAFLECSLSLWVDLLQPCFSLWNCAFLYCLITLSSAVCGRSVSMHFYLVIRRSTPLQINAALAPGHREPESWVCQQFPLHTWAGCGLVLLGCIWKVAEMPKRQGWYEGWVSTRKDTCDHPQLLSSYTLLDLRLCHTYLWSSLRPFKIFPLPYPS